MFNEETKQRFIAERNAEVVLPKNYLEIQFSKAEDTERELDKDLCNFNLYEIKEYYKLLGTSSVGVLKVLNSQFSLYTQWCINHGLVKDNQNHFNEMTEANFDDCINKALMDEKILTRETIMSWVAECINPSEKYILLALFEGICGKQYCEITKLRPEDIDGNTVTLCTGRKVEISNELKYIIEDCIEEKFHYGTKDKKIPLVDNGFVLKAQSNARESASDYNRQRTAYIALRRIFKAFDKTNVIKASDVYYSGMIHDIKTLSKQLGIKDTELIKSEKFLEIAKKFDCKLTPSSFIIRYRNYLD